jgi:hypothetical protein
MQVDQVRLGFIHEEGYTEKVYTSMAYLGQENAKIRLTLVKKM